MEVMLVMQLEYPAVLDVALASNGMNAADMKNCEVTLVSNVSAH